MKTRKNLLVSALSFALCYVSMAFAQVSTPPSSGVGFTSVKQALTELKSRPGVAITTTEPDGWVIISEADGMSVWSFAPKSHYAYPAVVHRTLKIVSDGNLMVQMRGLCEAKKEPCDKLMQEFEAMNAQMQGQVQNSLNGRNGKQ
jgi:hypothetical protein